MPVKGIARVKRNYRKTVERLAGPVTESAVYAVLQSGAGLADTMTPVDTSFLINSRYAPQTSIANGRVSGNVGYTANYAAAVHSAPGILAGQPRQNGNGNYWSPAGEPQFLTKGFEELKPSIPTILKRYSRV